MSSPKWKQVNRCCSQSKHNRS